MEVLARDKWGTLRTFYKQSILKLTYRMYHSDLPSCMTAQVSSFNASFITFTLFTKQIQLIIKFSTSDNAILAF